MRDGMRFFLAGATGVLGSRVVPRLAAAGHQVTAATRSQAKAGALRAAGAAPVLVDVFDRDTLTAAVADAAPDLVMHQLTDLSGGNTAANARIRVTGTRNLGDGAADESVPLDLSAAGPRSGTVRGVVALETAVRERPEWVVLRYGLLYGPGTWYAPDGMYAEQARAGRLAADENVSSFVHADDAAAAAVEALSWPSGVVNVCDNEPAPGRDWVPAFCRAVGAPAPPPPLDGEPARAGWARGAGNRHARHDLGWKPRYPSWRDGFGEFSR